MTPRYKVVIVGCGNIAGLHEKSDSLFPYSHGRAFFDHPSFELVGCIDAERNKAREFSEKYSIAYYGEEIDQIIDQTTPHVVSVCTPDGTHYELTKEILSRGRDSLGLIFLEKPACETRQEFIDLVSLSDDLDIPVIVNMSRRYHPWYRWLRKNYNNEEFGRLVRGDIFYDGGWRHNGVHAVDVVHFLFGRQLTNGKIIESWDGPEENDPTYTARLEMEETAVPVWFHGFSEQHYQVFDCDFKFTKGRFQIRNFEEKIQWNRSITNSLGERVLIPEDPGIPNVTTSTIQEAVQVIEKYLDSSKKENLAGYLLQDITGTMSVILDINDQVNA